MMVCSFKVISESWTPASGFGLETLEAIATESVSRMILYIPPEGQHTSSQREGRVEEAELTHYR